MSILTHSYAVTWPDLLILADSTVCKQNNKLKHPHERAFVELATENLPWPNDLRGLVLEGLLRWLKLG